MASDVTLPLRMSVEEMLSDPMLAHLGPRIEVLLNGTARDNVIAYDVEARTLTRFATDERGQFIIEGDEVRVETLTGDIGVRLRAEPADRSPEPPRT